ncbi:P1 family peptidase [Roseicyclus marinus]|uniref:P1 family peptidase n=1 Tax=Roseicyclus marinus TaxID=2161673 RepID=UPI00240FBAE0|nr:P1 family peptidase [Roseicyclus marinus]MDG3040900.1 P1 family peptidase [Roseicyclus marinus]
MIRPGPLNLITDVAGLRVGNARDDRIKTGATVLVGDRPFTAAVHVMGGAPGTRETDLLAPDKLVQEADALVLAGGSAFGLDAASGVADALRAQGRGFVVGDQTVPIVPGAILFDLLNGGEKAWTDNPYKPLGAAALANATKTFTLGSEGAGTGALIADLKGGLGSASAIWEGVTVGALVAVNALGRVTVGDGPHFWAAPFEMGDEFGGLGMAQGFDPHAIPPVKGHETRNTTIAIVATDAALTQAQATRMAIAAHDGMARAIWPSHTPMDGDIVFAAATGARSLPDPGRGALMLGHLAALCLARAIARGIHAATSAPGDTKPTWHDRFS